MFNLIFPSLSYTRCLFCQLKCPLNAKICHLCEEKIPKISMGCKICKHPLGYPQEHCTQCLIQKPAFNELLSAFYYEEPLRQLIHAFKYHQALHLKTYLASLILTAFPTSYTTECFIPVPLHPHRLYQRGFNQSLLLAKALSRQLKIPVDIHSCIKIKKTPTQAALSAKKRKKNLEHAFFIQTEIPYQHITLVDDIFTTGYTAHAIANTLKTAGVKTVNIACIARAMLETIQKPSPIR